ncbi:hypothetical protein COMA1_30366 [Candidatus Nitrospira nitrosa]|uniref:Uncharacterized protein n=1 Tax=Candidatus Nitrospira nitrosa TaxID=1742972 RepID=A0A0S4LM60_9BACT|nr:hypothetical protein COMA1_30366 [Candidatus Nitrospira nitrosa]
MTFSLECVVAHQRRGALYVAKNFGQLAPSDSHGCVNHHLERAHLRQAPVRTILSLGKVRGERRNNAERSHYL